jgi:outer membrane protein OmpA-like peptidoglycan-associated protein
VPANENATSPYSPADNSSSAGPDKVDVLAAVAFAFDSSELDPASRMTLDRLSVQISTMVHPLVEIHGYSDPTGSAEYNFHLSEERARVVRDYLIRAGRLRGTSIRIVGHGSEGALAPNTNPDGSDNVAGKEKNRRVELLIHDSPANPEKSQ